MGTTDTRLAGKVSRRHLLAATVAATGGAALGAACGAGSPASPPSASKAPATIRTLTRTDYDAPAWQAFTASTNGGIAVQTEPGPDTTKDYGAKILALAAAGSAPDVIFTHPNFFSTLAATKTLAELEPLAARAKFDLQGIQRELLDSDRWDGALYALPYSGVANLIVFNAGQFLKRGVPAPAEQAKTGRWTWETFRESLVKLTVRAPGQPPEVGMPEHFRGLVYMSQWLFGAGAQIWSKDLKRCLLDAKEALSALDFLAQLHYKDRVTIQPEESGDFGGSIQEGFPTGRVALRFRATTELSFYKDMPAAGAQLGVASVPKGPAGVTPRGAANSWGIWRQSKAPDAAWKAVAGWHGDPILKQVYSTRNCFPCRQSQFDHPTFKAALYPWEDLDVERAALRDVRIMATPARFTEIDDIWSKAWLAARDGKKSIKDLMAEFVPQANALLS